jgi:hypothetical protein
MATYAASSLQRDSAPLPALWILDNANDIGAFEDFGDPMVFAVIIVSTVTFYLTVSC